MIAAVFWLRHQEETATFREQRETAIQLIDSSWTEMGPFGRTDMLSGWRVNSSADEN